MEIIEQLLRRDRPGLLVSVRSADEALATLAGGADVVDVKEPNRGPLGAADHEVIADIVRAVDGRAPVTAAAGELVDLLPALSNNSCTPLPAGVSLAKIGLSNCAKLNNWKALWQQAAVELQDNRNSHARPVAVVYADWQAAASPSPDEIYSSALEIGCRVVLIDTWDKAAGTLFNHWPREELRFFVDRARHSGKFAVVLAGSLTGANLLRAAELQPNLIAVRGAACESGRNSSVSQKRVSELCALFSSLRRRHRIGMKRAAASRLLEDRFGTKNFLDKGDQISILVSLGCTSASSWGSERRYASDSGGIVARD